jgi:hypothetical protein
MDRFENAYLKIARTIGESYGLVVKKGDVVDPNTGDFNGCEIMVDHALDSETALFVLIHLFGHSVQWNISEEFRKLGQDPNLKPDETQLAKIYDYEKDATRYSIQLMHEAGVVDMDRWASVWWDADWKWLSHYYRTGERLDPKSLLDPDGAELLTPKPIPAFVPQTFESRWSF